MTDIQEVTIESRRLAAQEVLTHEGLFSQTQTLGEHYYEPRLVREGGVSFGRPIVYQLSLDDFPALVRQRPDVQHRTFILVEFPFDLDEVSGSRRYVQARFTVMLNTSDAVARSLWPTLVTTQLDVERSRSFIVTADLSLGSLSTAPSAECAVNKIFRYVELRPVITSFGSGQHSFSWKFEEQDGHPLMASGRTVFAVLDLPHDTQTLMGSFTVEAVVARRVLGVFEQVNTKTRSRSFSLQLTDGAVMLAPLGKD